MEDREGCGNTWKLTVARLVVEFPQRPFRTRDLGIFAARRDAIEAARREHATFILAAFVNDQYAAALAQPSSAEHATFILAAFVNELLVVCAEKQELENLVRGLYQQGLIVDVSQATKPLRELETRGVEASVGGVSARAYPPLPETINPPLCECCQMAPAMFRWPSNVAPHQDETSADQWTDEDLCSACFSIRARGVTLAKLARWDSGHVAWVRVHLELPELLWALSHLLREYIRSVCSHPPEKLDEMQARFPLVRDFACRT